MKPGIWLGWADALRTSRFAPLLRLLLEDGGVFKLFLSQIMLAITPLLGASASSRWTVLAELLEDPEASNSFAEHLKEVEP